ncbi:aminotransferase class I/II-fold pyridoxal phosphate-dependent enzyme [Ruminococcaceae bacterium OttesenSCG-928-I18]|nr:aminotransferase class I/II-fold pyridoxal phosphate-dependent enzyme [Ruminococcaceae bacterium OttesenSCG-928-I18]
MSDFTKMDKAALQQQQQALQSELSRYEGMNLKLDMSRGKPAADQLDLSLGLFDYKDYKDETGVDARNYGQLDGLPEAKRYFAELMGVKPEETVVGNNATLQMMYQLIHIGWQFGFEGGKGPWKDEQSPKFLCPVPGYDRHFRVTEVFGFELVMVPMTPDGPDMDILEELAKDPAVKGVWCVPVYSNPDGYVYSEQTVHRLAKMGTGAPDFKIIWDNAYGFHHLTDTKYTVPNLLDACREAGNEDRPVMLCSTSKVTFAGGGVAALAASASVVKQYVKYLSIMLISPDKVNQLHHTRFLKQVGMDAHMKKQAAIIRPKFEKVIDILHKNLDGTGIARWTEPKGGYFISLFVPQGCAARTVELCKQAGVVMTPAGAAYPYGIDPKDEHIRIAPTFPPIEELETAAELLCIAVRLAAVEKLLQN